MSVTNAAVSVRPVLLRARSLRVICGTIELGLALVVAGSVAAIGSVHPWAYVPLWIAAIGLLLLAARAAAVRGLRQFLGRKRFAFHTSGRWLILEPTEEEGPAAWSFDLAAPLFPRGPLVVPGLVFTAWVLVQLAVPWPKRGGLTISPQATARGLAFVVAAIGIHELAAAVFVQRQARERFRKMVGGLGLVIALMALVQLASGTTRIYGLFEPIDSSALSFGAFVNRDHFAGYMLMVVPISLALLGRAWRRYLDRVGTNPNLRRRLVALESPQGVALVTAVLPPVACIGALVATTSRGALLAFVASLALAGIGLRRAGGVPAWAMALAFLAVTVSWFGVERLEARFGRAAGEAPGRTLVWRDAISRMDGLWLSGSGFNTFGLETSRVSAWSLPKGATPWPEGMAATLESGARVGYRAVPGLRTRVWYREAHNDYVQLLVEVGIPGLLIALWAAIRLLGAARSDPWLLAALTGVLLHELVDFDLQIPAVAMLFVALAAPCGRLRASDQ